MHSLARPALASASFLLLGAMYPAAAAPGQAPASDAVVAQGLMTKAQAVIVDPDDDDDAVVIERPAAARPLLGYRSFDDSRIARSDPDAMARCAAQFRSFDPRTGTYVTYGGDVVVCPYLRD